MTSYNTTASSEARHIIAKFIGRQNDEGILDAILNAFFAEDNARKSINPENASPIPPQQEVEKMPTYNESKRREQEAQQQGLASVPRLESGSMLTKPSEVDT